MFLQKPSRNGAHLSRQHIPARGPNLQRGHLHFRHLQRRHPDLPHQGLHRGGETAVGDRPRTGQGEGYVSTPVTARFRNSYISTFFQKEHGVGGGRRGGGGERRTRGLVGHRQEAGISTERPANVQRGLGQALEEPDETAQRDGDQRRP